MQKLCSQDPSGKGEHCFCIDIDTQRGVKKCCKCNHGMSKEMIGQKMRTLDNFNCNLIKLSVW